MPPKKMNKTSHVLSLIASEESGDSKPPEQRVNAVKQSDLGEIIAGQLQKELDLSIEENRSAAKGPAPVVSAGIQPLPDYKNSESEMKNMDETAFAKHENSSEDYIAVNIVEDIVKSKALAFVKRFGMCDCHRCVSDVIALALNDLPARYTVTHKGMLFTKIASYENQYSADINRALTQACMLVNETPRH